MQGNYGGKYEKVLYSVQEECVMLKSGLIAARAESRVDLKVLQGECSWWAGVSARQDS